jgi:O-antigen/teichoic acid export membrane protein
LKTSTRAPRDYASRLVRAVAGTLGSQGVAFLAIPFVFRLYSPAEFGLWASLQAATLMLCAVATLRLEFALVKEPDPVQAGRLFWICLVGGSGLGLMLGLGLWGLLALAPRPILTTADAILSLIWLLSLIGNAVMVNWLLRSGRFARCSAAIFGAGVVTNLVQIALASGLGAHRHGLLIGSLLGQVAAVAIGAAGMGKDRPCAPSWRFADWITLIVSHRRFALYTLPYTLLVQARERAAMFVLGGYGTGSDVGRYSQAVRLTGLPAMLTGAAFRPVTFQEASRSSLAEVEPLVLNLMELVVVAVTPAMGVLVASPGYLSGAVLGPAWVAAGPVAAALAPSAFLYALTSWMDRLFDVKDRHEVNLQLELFTAIGSLGVFWACLALRRSLLEASLLQGSLLVFAYLMKAVFVFRLSGFRLARLAWMLAWSLALGALAWSVTTLVGAALGEGWGLAAGMADAVICSTAGAAWLSRSLLPRLRRRWIR